MSVSVIKLETGKNTRRSDRSNYICCDWPKEEFTADSWVVVLETGNEELQKNEKYYNLGQNKMRNKTTPPPESMMNSRSNQSAPFFPSLKWGRGGLNFSFILSKIVGLEVCRPSMTGTAKYFLENYWTSFPSVKVAKDVTHIRRMFCAILFVFVIDCPYPAGK